MADRRRHLIAALRAAYGAPAAETVDWWSLRRRILEQAGFAGRRRSLWDLALWRRALLPVACAATILMALAIADTRSTLLSSTLVRADSSDVAAWFRAASAGGAVSQRDLDPLLDQSGRIGGGQDAWLGAALSPASD